MNSQRLKCRTAGPEGVTRCEMRECGHEASASFRRRTPRRVTRWRALCSCCVEVWTVIATLNGTLAEVEVIKPTRPDAITWDDVMAAREWLRGYDGGAGGLAA